MHVYKKTNKLMLFGNNLNTKFSLKFKNYVKCFVNTGPVTVACIGKGWLHINVRP